MDNKLKEKKVFLDNLPRIESGRSKGKIDWVKSMGHKVEFIYKDAQGVLEIINYEKGRNGKITIKYDNNPEIKIYLFRFKKGGIGRALGKYSTDFKFNIGKHLKDDKRDIIITDKKVMKDKRGQEKRYYKYQCNKCNFDSGKHYSINDRQFKEELWTKESVLDSGQGCSCCRGLSVVENINSIYKTDTWMISIIGEEIAKTHTHSSRKEVYPTCPKCLKIKDKKMLIWVIYQNHSMGCGCSKNNR